MQHSNTMAPPEEEAGDTTMADAPAGAEKAKARKYLELFTCTISKPEYAYAQLELVTDGTAAAAAFARPALDALELRAHCTAALTQFLGATGAGMSMDILKVEGNEGWVRLAREDLGPFAAAIAAWPGASSSSSSDETRSILRIRASGNWLGSLLGRAEQSKLWHP